MKYQLGKTSRLGDRKTNEDYIGVAEASDAVLLVLADGMGGYHGGKIASKALVDQMLGHFKSSQFPVENPQAYLKELIADAHLAVIRAGSEQSPPVEPRTTGLVCLVQDGCAWWAHVGDSRLYLFRMDKPFIRTVDHSKIEELFRKGKITRKEMEKHPQRNLVTRCVGFQQHPPVATVSDKILLEKNDTLLLCSDGLWGSLSDELIEETLASYTITMAVENLASQAESGAYPDSDNVSMIAFRWVSSESDKKTDSSEEKNDPPKAVEKDEITQPMDELDKQVNKKPS